MAAKSYLIRIEPENEIKFIGPFVNTISTTLKVTNITDRKVFFKIKTTAPRSYCVRPNNGLVSPNEASTVQVMLQPFEYNVDDKDRMKHKFMVQSRYAPDEATVADSDNAFKDLQAGVEIFDARLKCVFEIPAKSDDHISSTNDTSVTSPEKQPSQEPIVSSVGVSSLGRGGSTEVDSTKIAVEIDTLRRRNTSLLEENAKLKKSTYENRARVSQTQKPASTFSLLNILLALMILMDESSSNLVDIPADGYVKLKGSQLKDLIESLHKCPSVSKGKPGDRFVIKKRNVKSIDVQCMDCDMEAEIPIGSENS
ncbi:hypothetical protein LOD99_2527 [Oopsacas minuta]|uniref:MSP domain-containing protein n=1 Tax=Oopsacas minuta TaxID=111878 RepID=A0AAV7K3F6_9METZ|nr:hypothetical protein LOD99_2527 [Oopsacas minuta]